MERLKRIGQIKVKSAAEVEKTRLGIGFEKLDRAVFDPEKAYDKIAAIGVKWTRIQSGWARTEKEKGVYDFAWLDDIVDNLLRRGLTPWMVLCYGNPVYSSYAEKYFGAVGCPPISTKEEMDAWIRYVEATVAHFKGRIPYYEIWNEPDGGYSWKHPHGENEPEPGPNATEYGKFAIETADAIHRADPDAKAIGLVVCSFKKLPYINEALATGLADHIDAASFHAYVSDDTDRPTYIALLRKLLDSYRPGLELIQTETGGQSRSDGSGAMHGFAWTPERQMKHQLRNLLHDLASDITFTSFFTSMDMIEALRGLNADKKSYLDYGYFGVLSADFDENGFSTGEYTPKPAYYSLQNLASVFSESVTPDSSVVYVRKTLECRRLNGSDCKDKTVCSYAFSKPNGAKAIAYWNAVPLLTSTYAGTISFEVYGQPNDIRLVDLASGTVYALPEDMIAEKGNGQIDLVNIPLTDSPMLLTFGDFVEQ